MTESLETSLMRSALSSELYSRKRLASFRSTVTLTSYSLSGSSMGGKLYVHSVDLSVFVMNCFVISSKKDGGTLSAGAIVNKVAAKTRRI